MLTSNRTPRRLRFPIGRFVLQVATGTLCVLGVIAGLISCASSRSSAEPEPSASTSSELTVAGLFSTGVDATGTPLPVGAIDPHYVLSSNDPSRPGPHALVVAPVGTWTGNTPTSNWLSAQANAIGANFAVYTFTTTFTLTGVDPSTATLIGSWACDDSCVILLNGTVVATHSAPAWDNVATFTVAAGNPFVKGVNTLAFAATNSGGGATGLQVVSLSGSVFGCTADDQCSIAQFCNTETHGCESTLPSGTPIPTIMGHTPVLDGVCAAGVGEVVCDAGVCDIANNECGLGVGIGPCTPANAAIVCQSGDCSTNGTCEPTGGCNVDADCQSGACDTTTNVCIPSLDAGLDGSTSEAGGLDGNAGTGEGGEGLDGSPSSGEDGGLDSSAAADAAEDASGDASANGDARADGAAEGGGHDAGRRATDGGSNEPGALEGGGLSCDVSRSGSSESRDAPLFVWTLALGAAFGRRRRSRSTGDRCE